MNDEKKEKNKDQDEFEVEEVNSEIEEISEEDYSEEENEEKKDLKKTGKSKKMKNLMSLTILLAGLFLGSLFVDLSQVIKGEGYSTKKLNKAEIFEANGKTWVAFEEPAVGVSVISDDSCEKCDPSEVLVWLRRILPTVSAKKISYDSEEGKKMIDKFKIKTLPAFVFEKDLEKTDFYTQAQVLFSLNEENYILNSQELGVPVGRYLSLPQIKEDDAKLGKEDAKVKIIVFSDFQCPYCNVFYKNLRDTMKEYQDKVLVAFKEFPLEIHPQAQESSLAGECALEQGKFWEYADNLYAKQAEWGNDNANAKFKSYAVKLKLNSEQFNKCLDEKKYQSKIEASQKEAEEFGISGTPTIFINEDMQSGVLSVEQLKEKIEAELKK